MNFNKIAAATVAVLFAGLAVSPVANASLVFIGAQDFQGARLGAAHTILTIQSSGNSTIETGSVGRSLTSPNDVVIGDAQTRGSDTQTRRLSALGVTSAANLRVVFRALEPIRANSILLSNLVLFIFSPTGALLFDSGAFVPVNFETTETSAGVSNFVFELDTAQVSVAQAAAFGAGFGNNRVGLAATANNATGGHERFFVVNGAPGGGGDPAGNAVPEPATLALVGLGLFGAIGARRRKQ